MPVGVRGIYSPPAEELDPLLGDVTLAQRAFDVHFPAAAAPVPAFVSTNEGVNANQRTALLENALGPFPDTVVRSKTDWIDVRAGGIDMILKDPPTCCSPSPSW